MMQKTRTANMHNLPDSEKIRFLRQLRTYLQERVAEERYYQAVVLQKINHGDI